MLLGFLSIIFEGKVFSENKNLRHAETWQVWSGVFLVQPDFVHSLLDGSRQMGHFGEVGQHSRQQDHCVPRLDVVPTLQTLDQVSGHLTQETSKTQGYSYFTNKYFSEINSFNEKFKQTVGRMI